MDKSQTIKMIMDKIKPDEQIFKLVQCIVENTIDILEEKGMIDYSKCMESEGEINSAVAAEKIAKLIELGCDDKLIRKLLDGKLMVCKNERL